MKQYTENQYDDDLTVGTDDYDDSYYTGSVDLFEFSNDEESPISRLKSLILSIDWEITDEILMEFNEELVDLRDIWAGEKINLIYVQALEKISKYIYQRKADSHPSAIKLLLTLYHNLEKIVSSVDLTEQQKKEILLEDVKRFESLKGHIDKQGHTVDDSQSDQLKLQKKNENIDTADDLLDLKAIVLGIDWEITDQDLNELRLEVIRLEEKFGGSRPRLILLQGIGKLGAYIKLKKSNAHLDAFKILHLFYDTLEKIVTRPMKLEEEKALLVPAIERFNSFKILLDPSTSSGASKRDEKEVDEDAGTSNAVAIAPAFADLPEDEIKGFHAEEEAKVLGLESSGNVDNHIDSFFKIDNSLEPDVNVPAAGAGIPNEYNHEIALQGVDVEEDGDEDEREVPSENDTLAPALSLAIEQKDEVSSVFEGEELSPAEDLVVADESLELPVEDSLEISGEADFPNEDEENSYHDFSKLDKEIVLQGVDVETEADDDSEEEALPMSEGELAPALAENDEVSLYTEEKFDNLAEFKSVDEEISGTIGGFFDEEIESHLSVAPKVEEDDLGVAPVVDESENDKTDITVSGDALASFSSEQTTIEVQKSGGSKEETDSPLSTMENAVIHAEEPVISVEDNLESIISETELEEDDTIAFVSELEQDKNLDIFFDDRAFEQGTESHLKNKQEETTTEIDDQLDSFFDLEEGAEVPEDDKLLSALPGKTIENDASVEKDVCSSVVETIEEEEVVFELAEEEDELRDSESDIGIIGAAEFNELLSSENISDTFEINQSTTDYGALGTCVDSLGIELDDKVIAGLWVEINRLQQDLADKPLEKTFLQLLSTVTRHIDQNRYDSSTDAYVLLQSVCRTLNELYEDDLHQNLEMLLVATRKVLEWQDKNLTEQAARNEAELTIGDSVLTSLDSTQGDFDELAQDYEEDQITQNLDSGELNSTANRKSSVTEERFGKVSDQSELGDESVRLAEGQEKIAGGEEDTEILSDGLKQEISSLRQTLQDEIEELRNELNTESP